MGAGVYMCSCHDVVCKLEVDMFTCLLNPIYGLA